MPPSGRTAARGVYRVSALELEEDRGSSLPAPPEVIIPAGLSRNPSTESLVSTQSSVYSGLEDLTQVMSEVPPELLCAVKSSSRIQPATSNPPDLITPPSSTAADESQSPKTSSSSSEAVLGKRKPSFSDELPSSSVAKNARTDDPVQVIAYHQRMQRVFDSKGVPFGAQWLIARFVTLGRITYEDISISDVDRLKGSNTIAAPIIEQMFGTSNGKQDGPGFFSREKAATSPWSELDREQDCARTGRGFHRQPDGWYGGKVHFTATLKPCNDDDRSKDAGSANYRIYLNRPELGPSSRLSRQFGSHAILRVRISRTVLNRAKTILLKFFSRPFVLCGIIYRAFYAKDGTVFLVATNECPGIGRLPLHARPQPLSFIDFLNWHNPIMLNNSQTMAKWASRFALGLSNSVPGIVIDEANIQYLEDEVSGSSDMTDGSGFLNLAAIKQLRDLFNWDTCPTAVQCRITGAKGLLVLHPDPSENQSATPRVWLRPSQIKIRYPANQPLSRAHTTIDVLRSSHLRSPSRLSAETIINLAENHVPHQVFIDLMKENLDNIVDPLLEWQGSDAMFRLWHNVARSGGVIAARMAREAVGEARMRGYFVKDAEDEDEDDLDGFLDMPQSAAWWADETSGCPSSLEETILVLLDAGFTPQECPLLAEKLKSVIKTSVESYVQRYRLEVPMSCIAWMIPDPTGTLASDEVQILSRDTRFLLPDGTRSHVVLGDVLLTRHPCKLPTDVQKVKAVMKSQLQNYTDVIVCPIQGTRRFADLLAGGDYDGDKAIAIWQPTIVASFKNAPLHYSYPPKDLLQNFHEANVSAAGLLEKQSHDMGLFTSCIQSFLLAGLQDVTSVGKYSNFHDIAIYTLGYDHPETIRLAYMFCNILDGAKNGLTILSEVAKMDSKKFQRRPPSWKEIADEAAHAGNELNVARPSSLPPFVMDTIFTHAQQYRGIKLSKMENAFPQWTSKDQALLKPWNDAEERIQHLHQQDPQHTMRMTTELSRIQAHVKNILQEFKSQIRSNFTSLRIERRQDILRSLAQQFAKSPDSSSFLCFSDDELAQLKASYAYHIDGYNGRFSFSIAMRELGYIKAKSLGPTKTVQLGFYDRFIMKQSLFQ